MGQSLSVLLNKKKGSKGPTQHVLPIPRKLFFLGLAAWNLFDVGNQSVPSGK